MSDQTNNANTLFQTAAQQTVISPTSLSILSAGGIGQKVQAAMGVPVSDVTTDDVMLLQLEIDDSSSIRDADNEQIVRDGVNLTLDAVQDSKAENEVLATLWQLNRGVLDPYKKVKDTTRLNATNYIGSGSTPLYDRTIELLGAIVAKEQEFANAGVSVRTVTLIVTDGQDYGSRARASEVRSLVMDLVSRENHLICAMGVDNGSTDFRKIFAEMGIRDANILTPANSASEIRKAFQVFSNTAKQASQGARAFSNAFTQGVNATP